MRLIKKNVIKQLGVVVATSFETLVGDNFAKQAVKTVDGATFLKNRTLPQEVFLPYSMVVHCENAKELEVVIPKLEGQS